MMLFYRNNLFNIFCSLVRKPNRCVLSVKTELSYCLAVSTAKNISLCCCNKAGIKKENPDFRNYSDYDIDALSNDTNVRRACRHLLVNGVDVQSLMKYEKYLSKSPKDSYMKARLLTEITFDTSVILPLVKLPITRLKWIVLRSKEDPSLCHDFPDRLSYLCHHLEVNVNDLVNSLSKHSTLLTMDFSRLANKMLVLKDSGISAGDLAKDLWIFNYNEDLLVDRISKLQQGGMPIKPWLLRCCESSFENRLSKWKTTQFLLKGRSELSFLAEKLNCSEDYIKYMISRNRLLSTINVPKLEQIINFLYEKGYTPEELRIFPRVFCSSVKTLSARFDEYYKLKGTMPTISQLCFSVEHYIHCLKSP